MVCTNRDDTLEALLDLNGTSFILEDGEHVVRFVAHKVAPSEERPHGIVYSLTLHDGRGKRLVGFDNAHAVAVRSGPSGRQRLEHDHRNRLENTRPYDYRSAAKLLEDFWAEVDAVLKARGVR